MITQDQVTIIIPHLGESEESRYALDQCLISLNESVPDMKKIIVKNGGQGDQEGQWGISNTHNTENETVIILWDQGQCKAVNAAVATVNTPWIFVTNDDMVYAPGWWERLTSFTNPAIKCISPILVEPRKGAPTFIEYFCGGAGGDFDKQKFLDFDKKNRSSRDIRNGFNLPFLIQKEVWDTVGGYDINYDPWGSNSDSDLEYKIKLSGVHLYQHPNCLVYHFSQTSGTFEPRNNRHYQHNFQVFIDKWGFPRTDDGIWEATFEIPKENIYHPDWEGKYGIR